MYRSFNARQLAAIGILMCACVTKQDLGEVDDAGSSTGGEDDDGGTTAPGTSGNPSTTLPGGSEDTGGDPTTGDPPPTTHDSVSVLFVIDNSGSMGEEQAMIAPAAGLLADNLTTAGVDWRIAVTTTDNGNPWCQGTTPEGGALVMSSCRSRLTDFVFNGATTIDASDVACTSICPAEWTDIQVQPTATEPGGALAARPWMQSIGGATNLPAGLAPGQAMQCVVPQGISGCGFEHTLESTYRAIDRMETVGDPAEGFLPPGALLAVVIVTDEADCSHNEDYEDIFLPEGNRVFWSDPESGAPTSAVCWNAGVQCVGGDCFTANYDVDANPVDAAQAPTDAVIRPLARYLAKLAPFDPVVTIIAGVQSDGSTVYDVSGSDPGFVDAFGIGPGCSSAAGQAVPPVRLREVAEVNSDGTRNQYSICDADYAPAIDALTASIAARIE